MLKEKLTSLKSSIQQGRDQIRRTLGKLLFDQHKIDDGVVRNKLVLVRWDAKLGDAIVSSWFIREVKIHYPEMNICVITTPQMAPLFRQHFFADTVYEIPKRASYTQLAKLAKAIGPVDYLIHLSKTMKMKDIYFIRKMSIRFIVGMDDELDCVNIKLGEKSKGMHFADKFELITKQMGIKSPNKQYVVPCINDDEQKVNRWWPNDTLPIICFNPYGSGGARRLNPSNIISITNLILESSETSVCLLYPPDMESTIKDIVLQLSTPDRVLISPDSPSIGGMIAQIRRCTGLISVDTATIHIATGLGIPTVGLYNPDTQVGDDNFSEWHPNNSKSLVVFSEKTKNISVNSINHEKVIESLKQILKSE